MALSLSNYGNQYREMIVKRPLVLFVLCASSLATQAATVVLDGTNAVAILGLNVGGQLYDVSFQTAVFGDIARPGLFPFFGDLSGASEARDKVIILLNDSSASSVGGADNAWIAYRQVASSGGSIAIQAVGPSYLEGSWESSDFISSIADSNNYALFAAVPVPATIWLLATALGFLGLVKRRIRSRKSTFAS